MKKEERDAGLDYIMSRLLKPEKRQRLELKLLKRIKQRKAALKEMLELMSGHGTYEDHFYRYYHAAAFQGLWHQNAAEKARETLARAFAGARIEFSFCGSRPWRVGQGI